MEQKVFIKSENSEKGFGDEYIILDVEPGTKILSNEPYVKELYEMYEKSFNGEDISYSDLEEGKVINATVSSVTDNVATLEVDRKHTIHLNIKKEDQTYLDYIRVGRDIDVKINQQSSNGEFSASFTDAIKENKFNEIKDSIGKPIAYKAVVNELIHGGYYLTIDSIKVFMPGSLGGMNKLWDFNALLNKEIIVMPINFSREKNTIVVSHREYLKTILPIEIQKIKDNIDIEYTGYVTGATDFGIFVELNQCVTGLIPKVELNEETLKMFRNKDIKPGNELTFLIKDIISDKKIILTQLKEDVWKDIDQKYKPKDKVKGKVIKIRNYGAFIELEKNIIGLLHSSEFEKNTLKEKDEVEVTIDKIDIDNKKVVLKM